MRMENGGLWVFGYGSLMWRPGFAFVQRRSALIRGFRRALCVYSHVHRGTAERPGLVLGLDHGGSCRGVAFEVAAQDAPDVLDYLRAREQATMVYREIMVAAQLDDGRIVTALAYAVDRTHAQYAGRLPAEALLRLVTQGEGVSGANPDYVIQTHDHLRELGIRDDTLGWLTESLRRVRAEAGP